MTKRALDDSDAVTFAESRDLLSMALIKLAAIEEGLEVGEIKPERAVPRAILCAAEAQAYLAFLIALIALRFPQLVNEDDKVPDLASLRYRMRN